MNRLISATANMPAAAAANTAAQSVLSSTMNGIRNMSATAFQNVSHVIFDMDGLLLGKHSFNSLLFIINNYI